MQRWRLLISDLFWPDPRDTAPYDGLTLPALSRLLSRGEVRTGEPQAPETWIAQRFDTATSENDFPWAAVERAGLHLGDQNRSWCRADPVHLKTRRNALYLAHGHSLALTSDETRALTQSLNAHFAPDGMVFEVVSPATTPHWHIGLDRPASVRTTPVAQAQGRNIDSLMPSGTDASIWIRRLNEAQMLLHEHPVNATRAASGMLTINSIWPWGFGETPTLTKPDFDVLVTSEPMHAGCSTIAGIDSISANSLHEISHANAQHAAALVILDAPREALARNSGDAWRDALSDIETQWLAPLLHALQKGQCQELEVIALSQDSSITARATRGMMFRFWRNKRSWIEWRPEPLQ